MNNDILNKMHFFPQSEWQERGLNPSKNSIIKEMNTVIQGLVKLCKIHWDTICKDTSLIENYISKRVDWDDFDTEEAEFLADKIFEVIYEGFEIEESQFNFFPF